jgi:hypothetical protein
MTDDSSSGMEWVDGPMTPDSLAENAERRLAARGCICDNGKLTVIHRIDDSHEPPVVYQEAFHGDVDCPLRPRMNRAQRRAK